MDDVSLMAKVICEECNKKTETTAVTKFADGIGQRIHVCSTEHLRDLIRYPQGQRVYADAALA